MPESEWRGVRKHSSSVEANVFHARCKSAAPSIASASCSPAHISPVCAIPSPPLTTACQSSSPPMSSSMSDVGSTATPGSAHCPSRRAAPLARTNRRATAAATPGSATQLTAHPSRARRMLQSGSPVRSRVRGGGALAMLPRAGTLELRWRSTASATKNPSPPPHIDPYPSASLLLSLPDCSSSPSNPTRWPRGIPPRRRTACRTAATAARQFSRLISTILSAPQSEWMPHVHGGSEDSQGTSNASPARPMSCRPARGTALPAASVPLPPCTTWPSWSPRLPLPPVLRLPPAPSPLSPPWARLRRTCSCSTSSHSSCHATTSAATL
eukprot:scaffold2217_cov132-Isochrysis_galbana.AAC.13